MRFVRHIRIILVALLLPVNVYAQGQARAITTTGSVTKIEGAGETASGLKTYDVTCKNGETYFLQNSPDGQWWAINADGNFDGLKGLKIDRAANAFCSSVMAQGQAQAPTPAPRNLSTAERLANQLGPNKNAGCLSEQCELRPLGWLQCLHQERCEWDPPPKRH